MSNVLIIILFTLGLLMLGAGVLALCSHRFIELKRNRRREVILIAICGAVLMVTTSVRTFGIEVGQVPTASMSPGIMIGDTLLIDKYSYGMRLPGKGGAKITSGEPLQRGDVAVFWPPETAMRGTQGTRYLKRVIGIPGDTITFDEDGISVNAERLERTPLPTPPHEPDYIRYVQERLGDVRFTVRLDTRAGKSGMEHAMSVKDGHYFMVGDNRHDSHDSRIFGVVPDAHLIGKPIIKVANWEAHKPDFRYAGFIN